MYYKSYPGILLKTISSLIKAGKVGKLAKDIIPQSFSVNICKYLYFYNSALISAVK